jgi:ubiquinone/menaquinone biosynthesis C-methylase UbiE
VHHDDEHRALLLDILALKSGERVLDLGTGNGYLAFAIARSHPDVEVLGLDIAEAAIKKNACRASEEELGNLRFEVYDGLDLPSGLLVDAIVSRYAVHHFPDLQRFARSAERALRPAGRLLVADPAPHEGDERSFADDFMRMKADGHVRLYSLDELKNAFFAVSLDFVANLPTHIDFPRPWDARYQKLLDSAQVGVTELYALRREGVDLRIELLVNNALFRKTWG